MNPETSYITSKPLSSALNSNLLQAETYRLSNIKATHTRDSGWEARNITSNQNSRENEVIIMELIKTEFGQDGRVYPQKHHGIFHDHKWSESCFHTSFTNKTS